MLSSWHFQAEYLFRHFNIILESKMMLTQCSSPSLFPRTGTVLNFLYPLSHIFSTISTISLCFTHQIHVNVIKPRPFESMIHLFFFFSQYSLTSYCCVSQFNCAKPLTSEKKEKKGIKNLYFFMATIFLLRWRTISWTLISLFLYFSDAFCYSDCLFFVPMCLSVKAVSSALMKLPDLVCFIFWHP